MNRLLLLVVIASLALQCMAAVNQAVDANEPASTAAVVPAVPALPSRLAPEVPSTPGAAEDASAATAVATTSKGWIKRSVTITQFWDGNVWFSAWFKSLNRAVQVASIVPSMSTLLAAVTAANAADPLSSSKTRWTILAPTNDDFDALLTALDRTPEQLLGDTELLRKVLSYHVIPSGALNSGQLMDGPYPTALAEKSVSVTLTKKVPGGVRITGGSPEIVATVIVPNIRAGRSIIHVIDRVLVPAP